MTVAGASRAILARFVAFHASPASVSYCRAIDFFAFIASTTLCLVHIEAARRCHHHHQHGGGGGGGGGGDLLRPLLHERHADRAVMQGLLDVVGRMSSTGPDPIARRIERILGPLLEIEANASRGGCYSVSAVEGEAGAEGGGGKQEEAAAGAAADFGDSSDAPRVLRIKIPFFGTIRIEHHPEWSASASPGYARGEDQQVGAAPAARNGCDGDVSSGGSVANDAQLAQQNASSAMSSNTLETDWTGAGAMSEHVSSLMPKNDDWTHNATGLYPGDGSEPYLFVPDLSSDEHWALQGVDIALFSNLTQGS
ncbi:C6 zinc finger domain containing protein [Cordyceps fumosorosea ARSEF 2679]|uniref:C6 zinc finger domain containing protein n=1 Tax=Cordyceps fumosorosea (strain ARSEF 2679) TaxID=1081104 RepID=A0A168CDL0_CORFA|nr:C6 zinc finger domain containing protein [Cordyceps fumosorosea ARSEF 2679]OAA71257.1 C6 zinc finger domain containing protein [Cordyceps fumosorosea ARSEF 2679]